MNVPLRDAREPARCAPHIAPPTCVWWCMVYAARLNVKDARCTSCLQEWPTQNTRARGTRWALVHRLSAYDELRVGTPLPSHADLMHQHRHLFHGFVWGEADGARLVVVGSGRVQFRRAACPDAAGLSGSSAPSKGHTRADLICRVEC